LAARQEPEPIVPALAIQDLEDAARQQYLQNAQEPSIWQDPPRSKEEIDKEIREGFQRGITGQYQEPFTPGPQKGVYIDPSKYEPPLEFLDDLLEEEEDTIYGTYSSKKDGVIDSAGKGHELDYEAGEHLWDWSDPELVERVYREDVARIAAVTIAKFPNLPEYTKETQSFLISDMYSGLLGQSPRARAHMRSERWEEAIAEYKDSHTWKKGLPGQKERMAKFIKHMKTLKSKPLPKHQDKNFHDWYEIVRKNQGFKGTHEDFETPSGRIVPRWIGPDHRRQKYDFYRLYLDPAFDYKTMSWRGKEMNRNKADGFIHLPSEYKHDDHENIIVGGVNTKTGEVIKPK